MTSSVFWIMKMTSTPTPMSEAIAPPLIRAPSFPATSALPSPGLC